MSGSVAGIVLAAGGSRRLGRPKQLLALRGRPMVQHVLDAAEASALGEIVVVLGHAATEVRSAIRLPARARCVVNGDWAAGQSTSLACGLAAIAADAEAALVLLGDQPAVTDALIDRLLALWRAQPEPPALRPCWRERDGTIVPGHPVVLGRVLWPAAARLDGDRGARALFAAHPEWLREVELEGPPPLDVDDEDDYRRTVEGG